MSDTSSLESTVQAFTIRRFCSDDAAGVTQLVKGVYGETYYPRDLYSPEEIVQLNQAEKLVSVVALDSAGQVIGHYALERPDLEPVAEASDAIVAPEYRHHHLLEEMRPLLREEAKRLGLTGMVGYAVTNHPFSQKAEDHFGSRPCGVALGMWPRSFHNMPEPLTQRMSFVIYFDYVSPAAHAVHVAAPHREMIARIYEQYGISYELCEVTRKVETGDIIVEHEPEVQTGTIRVRRAGADTAASLRQACEKLCDAGAKAVTLELPLVQPETAEVCRAAEEAGFFFSGLGPAFAADGDALLLQFLTEDVDLSLIDIENPFAKELLTYVGRERERVQKARRPKLT
jgi:N-acetylglutamate synthase-like GNAT family acetyltransferase